MESNEAGVQQEAPSVVSTGASGFAFMSAQPPVTATADVVAKVDEPS